MPKKTSTAIAKELATVVALDATKSARKAAKKHHKKKGTSFSSFLSSAASIAANIAPAVLPLLLAKHAPTMAASQKAAAAGVATPMVGTAAPVSLQPLAGFTSRRSLMRDGKEYGQRLCGMELIAEVGDSNGAGWSMGDVCRGIKLNPLSTDWSGTRLQTLATMYQRYRWNNVVFMYQPASASTTSGQLIGYVDADPDEDMTKTGADAVKTASNHAGAEVNQPWQMGCAHAVLDNVTSDLFLDLAVDDQRLTSGGVYRMLAATDLPSSGIGSYGSIFVAYDITLKLPNVSDESTAGISGVACYVQNGDYSIANGVPFPIIVDESAYVQPLAYGNLTNLYPWSQAGVSLSTGWYEISWYLVTSDNLTLNAYQYFVDGVPYDTGNSKAIFYDQVGNALSSVTLAARCTGGVWPRASDRVILHLSDSAMLIPSITFNITENVNYSFFSVVPVPSSIVQQVPPTLTQVAEAAKRRATRQESELVALREHEASMARRLAAIEQRLAFPETSLRTSSSTDLPGSTYTRQ